MSLSLSALAAQRGLSHNLARCAIVRHTLRDEVLRRPYPGMTTRRQDAGHASHIQGSETLALFTARCASVDDALGMTYAIEAGWRTLPASGHDSAGWAWLALSAGRRSNALTCMRAHREQTTGACAVSSNQGKSAANRPCLQSTRAVDRAGAGSSGCAELDPGLLVRGS
jgi:hypothetical protein